MELWDDVSEFESLARQARGCDRAGDREGALAILEVLDLLCRHQPEGGPRQRALLERIRCRHA